ncbi:hypothetical protein scyTo_0013052, partial [Scyliorhinus torazame]|nr:hypothetical protein [Scyliorhinus torazame]
GYDDGYGGEYDEQSYDTYDNSYASQVERSRRMGCISAEPEGTNPKVKRDLQRTSLWCLVVG